jgi:NDP-sugar pyrophosphorylase family protein
VIQAGGKGARLYPYTTILPKPLMPIGEFPVLEIVLRQLVHHGFPEITITVGHLGHLIMAVIGDGARLGAHIDYLWEAEPRGTIGALSQLEDPGGPLLVMNGDLLTDFDYGEFWEAHDTAGARLSVAICYKEVAVSLGVLELSANREIVGFREKPVLAFPCSMGIYILEPDILRLIPDSGIFGFDDLMATCLEQGILVRAHPFGGLWLDIGRPEDYANASKLFHENRARLFPQQKHSTNGLGARLM